MEPATTDVNTLRGHLDEVLPAALRASDEVRDMAVAYLARILAANQQVNLTGITAPREAVVKHLVDSLVPRRWFEGAASILDLGTGAGFPGVPLALWQPDTRVHLVESVQKKARAVADAVDGTGIRNVTVHALRAEELLRVMPVEVVTARAVGSLRKLLRLLRPVRAQFQRLVLYKGPEAAAELEEARRDAVAMGLVGRRAEEYELPDAMGRRAVVIYERTAGEPA